MEVNLDVIGHGSSQGQVAAEMEGGLNVNALRPFIGKDGNAYITVYKGGDKSKPESYAALEVNAGATLRRDEWKQLDEAVMAVSDTRLIGAADLIAAGLIYNLGDGMGTTVLESHTISDAFEAELSMDGLKRGKNDRQTYGTTYLPIPIIHVDYSINARVLTASRKMGNALDTTQAERAARKVAEKLESMLFTAATYSFGGGTIYSYLNHPDRNTVSLGTDWDNAAKTGKAIVDDILNMKKAAIAAKKYGPYQVYIPTAYETVLDEDYSDAKDTGTVRDRIEKINNIKGIKVVDQLPANNVIMVQMTSDVVRLVRGMGIQNVQWQSEGKFVNNFKVMTIQVPQIRADEEGNSGVVHLA